MSILYLFNNVNTILIKGMERQKIKEVIRSVSLTGITHLLHRWDESSILSHSILLKQELNE